MGIFSDVFGGLHGGYKMVDFDNADLSTTPVEVRNIYRRAQSFFAKRFVAFNFSINGERFAETGMSIHKNEDNNLVCDAGGYTFIITTDNKVSVERSSGSIVSVSATGTSTSEVNYITIDGVEKKLAGGGGEAPVQSVNG